MKSVWGVVGTVQIALCPRCRRETLPRAHAPAWHQDVHRAASKGMTAPVNRAAERIKRRKAEKAKLRATIREHGIAAAAKVFALTTTVVAPLMSEECADCLRLQRGLRAVG